ncbi:MAG: Holliday junction resolvase RuvX [Firmicutes bacterium]|nr:Holliday junction resolvase RuvX [Bacillota bacterium]
MGIDPGKDKCGLALVDDTGKVITQKIVSSRDLIAEIKGICKTDEVKLIIGDGTTSEKFLALLKEIDLPIEIVTESYSTLEAKDLYFEENGYGWQILLPKGLRSIRRPLDDYAARILVDRYLKANRN